MTTARGRYRPRRVARPTSSTATPPRPDHGRVWGLALRQIGERPEARGPAASLPLIHRRWEDAMTLKILPHGRLQEWVAEEQGYFAAEGLEYTFLPEGDHGSRPGRSAPAPSRRSAPGAAALTSAARATGRPPSPSRDRPTSGSMRCWTGRC